MLVIVLDHLSPMMKRRALPAQPWRCPMTKDELDLDRARDIAAQEYGDWHDLDDYSKDVCLAIARAIRKGDERRGLAVVPKQLSKNMGLQIEKSPEPRLVRDDFASEDDYWNAFYQSAWDAALAAAPLEDKP